MTGPFALCYAGSKDLIFKGFHPVKVLVDRLESSPSEFAFEGDSAWWESLAGEPGDGDPRPAGSARFALLAHKMAEGVYLEGQAAADFEFGCSRCLARYRHALREPFRIVLEPAGERIPSDPEGAAMLARYGVWLGDELEAGWYRGSEIDLTHYLQEVVALGLPVQPLCREECQGLCPQCGADRNTDTCSCEQARPASPFAVLQGIVTERGD